MTYNEIFELTLALMQEDKERSADYKKFALGGLNVLLAEVFRVNNSLRRVAGKPELAEIPRVSNFEETAACEDELCRHALPLGLASLLKLDEDSGQANYLNAEYKTALSLLSICEHGSVNDIYGGAQ